MKIDVMVASKEHLRYVTQINDAIDEAAKSRGTASPAVPTNISPIK